MASKSNIKPEISHWTRTRANAVKKQHNHKFDLGDLVSKYPGRVWEVIDLGAPKKADWGPTYQLRREVGEAVKRWKTVWVSEREIEGVFVS